MSTVFDILNSISSFLENIIRVESYIDAAHRYVTNLPYFAQLGGLILTVVVVILGIVSLIKMLTKIIIVIAIIIAIAVLYQQGVFG